MRRQHSRVTDATKTNEATVEDDARSEVSVLVFKTSVAQVHQTISCLQGVYIYKCKYICIYIHILCVTCTYIHILCVTRTYILCVYLYLSSTFESLSCEILGGTSEWLHTESACLVTRHVCI